MAAAGELQLVSSAAKSPACSASSPSSSCASSSSQPGASQARAMAPDVASFVARLMSLSPQQLSCLHSDERLMRHLSETQMLLESRLEASNKFALTSQQHQQHQQQSQAQNQPAANQQLMLLAQHASHQHQLQQQQQQAAAAAAAAALAMANNHSNAATNINYLDNNNNNNHHHNYQHPQHQLGQQPYFTHYVQLPIGFAVAGNSDPQQQQRHLQHVHLQQQQQHASFQQHMLNQQHQHNLNQHMAYAALDLSSPGATATYQNGLNFTTACQQAPLSPTSANKRARAKNGSNDDNNSQKKSRKTTNNNNNQLLALNNCSSGNNNKASEENVVRGDSTTGQTNGADDHQTMLNNIHNNKFLNKIASSNSNSNTRETSTPASKTTNHSTNQRKQARRRRSPFIEISTSPRSSSTASPSIASTSSTFSLNSPINYDSDLADASVPAPTKADNNNNHNHNNHLNQANQHKLSQIQHQHQAENQSAAPSQSALLQNNINNLMRQSSEVEKYVNNNNNNHNNNNNNHIIRTNISTTTTTTTTTTKRYKGEFDEPTEREIEERLRDLSKGKENYHQVNWLTGRCACVLGSKFTGSKTAGDVLGQIEAWRRLDVNERIAFKWSLDDLPQDIRLADIKRLEDLRRDASNGRADFGGASKRKPLGIRGTRQFLLILYCLWGHPGRQDAMQREGYCPHCFAKIRKANDQSTLVRVVNHFNMKHRKGANPRLSPSA